MRMQKRQFRIGELAKHLAIEKFVIRFWEKEFGLRPTRSGGGQRFYNEDDLQRFTMIKALLYEQGFTIAGARKHLEEAPKSQVIGSRKTTIEQATLPDALREELLALQQQLKALRSLL